MQMTAEDSERIYIARALGIILVVIGHYMWHPNWTWSPYLFHMPLFFIIGGITARPFRNPSNDLIKLTNNLILYYIRWYIIIGGITWFIKQNWDTKIVLNLGTGIDALYFPLIHNSHNNSLFMVGWFIIAYFFTSIVFRTTLTYLRSNLSHNTILVVGIMIGVIGIELIAPLYHSTKFWMVNIVSQVCVGLMFFTIGYWIKPKLTLLWRPATGVISVILLLLLVHNQLAHELGMSWSQYPDGFFIHLSSAVLGSAAVLSISNILVGTNTQKHLVLIGQNSKSIMTLHMLWLVIAGLFLSHFGLVERESMSALNHKVALNLSFVYIFFGLYGSLATAHIINVGRTKLRDLNTAS